MRTLVRYLKLQSVVMFVRKIELLHISQVEVQMKHTLFGKIASSEEIGMYYPAAFVFVSTAGLDLVDSQKSTRHTIQCDLVKSRQFISISIQDFIINLSIVL